ncbi:unnamed protein product [Blepharisma stoltei]|uniref:Serine/threonine protein phosphatase 2A regulatory subunit n=1 Tax=Blepharisma stoltei TaxID=1481888 RepID=A0AAU9ILJ1_9CILI|nr:unnamed protein product [Blepharisma stoltei]
MLSRGNSNWRDAGKDPAQKSEFPADKRSSTDELFIKLIEICCLKYDYSNEYKDIKSKALRNAALKKLLEFFSEPKNSAKYIIQHFDRLIDMIKLNIFRPPFLKRQKYSKADPDIENIEKISIFIDPAWPHLKNVYKNFLQLVIIEEIPFRILKSYLNYSFIQDLLEMLNTENFKEKKYVQVILVRLYAKVVPKRKLMRAVMENCLLEIIHEDREFEGTNELLEILASIISGFATPLKKDHAIFFIRVIIKLYKVENLESFYANLSRCTMMILSKDSSLVIPLIEGLLRYWPCWNSQREVLFLAELQKILGIYKSMESEAMTLRMLKKISRCLLSQNIQVVDGAMCFFESDIFLQILRESKEWTLPIFAPIVAEVADNHWDKEIKSSSEAIKEILIEIDACAFDLALQSYSKYNCVSILHHSQRRIEAENKWEVLANRAKTINPDSINHICLIQTRACLAINFSNQYPNYSNSKLSTNYY